MQMFVFRHFIHIKNCSSRQICPCEQFLSCFRHKPRQSSASSLCRLVSCVGPLLVGSSTSPRFLSQLFSSNCVYSLDGSTVPATCGCSTMQFAVCCVSCLHDASVALFITIVTSVSTADVVTDMSSVLSETPPDIIWLVSCGVDAAADMMTLSSHVTLPPLGTVDSKLPSESVRVTTNMGVACVSLPTSTLCTDPPPASVTGDRVTL